MKSQVYKWRCKVLANAETSQWITFRILGEAGEKAHVSNYLYHYNIRYMCVVRWNAVDKHITSPYRVSSFAAARVVKQGQCVQMNDEGKDGDRNLDSKHCLLFLLCRRRNAVRKLQQNMISLFNEPSIVCNMSTCSNHQRPTFSYSIESVRLNEHKDGYKLELRKM